MRTYGGSGPVLLLLHGFMQDATAWDGVAEVLAQHFRVFAPTMRLESARPGDLGALADGLFRTVEQVKKDAACTQLVLCGYSLGGRVALAYLRAHAETLAGLVLESPSLGPASEAQRAELAQRNEKRASLMEAAQSMEEIVDAWESEGLFATQRSLGVQAARAQRSMRLRARKEELVRLLREAGSHTMCLAEETCECLVASRVPTLYMAGQLDRAGMGQAEMLDAWGAEHLSTARFDCGHNIHLESPDAFCGRVQEFMEVLS